MRINNATQRAISLSYQNGTVVTVEGGSFVTRPATDIDGINETAAKLALFTSGQMFLTNDNGTSYTGRALATVPVAPAFFGLPMTYNKGPGGSVSLPTSIAQAVQVAAGKIARTLSKLVVIGDSWGQRNYSASGLVASYLDLGVTRWALALSGQRMEQILPLSAVGGTTSGDWLANRLEPVLAQLTEPCRIQVFLGTNDISSDVPAGDVTAPETSIYNLNRIFNRILGAGHILCINTVPPYGPSYVAQGASLAAKNANRRLLNRWIASFAANNGSVEFIDQYALLVDPANADGCMYAAYEDALTGGGNNPGIHCSAAGARAVGAAWAARWVGLIDPRQHTATNTDSYDTDTGGPNRLSNPLFTGTGGTSTPGAGTTITATTIAQGWSVSSGAGTSTTVCTVEARTVANDGDANGNNQVLTITGAGAADVVSLRTGSLAGRFAVGDQLYAEISIRVTNMAQVKGIRLSANHVLDGVPQVTTDMSYLSSGANYGQQDETIILRTPVYTVGQAAALTGQILGLDIAFAGVGGTATVRAGKARWVRVA